METEAFERARAFDTETIVRQNELIGNQRREIDRLATEVRNLKSELDACIRERRELPDRAPP